MENSNQQASVKLPTQEDVEKNKVMFVVIGYSTKEELLRSQKEDDAMNLNRELICASLGGCETNKLQADHMIQTLLHVLRTWGVEVTVARRDGETEFDATVKPEAANNATH